MLDEHPERTGARLRLAELLERRGKIDGAIAEYLVVVDAFVDHDLHPKATRLLQALIDRVPGRGDIAERLAELSRLAPTLPRRDLQIARLARRPAESLQAASLDASELRHYWSALGPSPLVAELSDDALGLLLGGCEVQRWSPRSIVVRAGQWLPRCYVIAEGAVEGIAALGGGRARVVHRVGPGDVIGSRALFEDLPWLVDYRTSDEITAALRLTRRSLGVATSLAVAELTAALGRHERAGDRAER